MHSPHYLFVTPLILSLLFGASTATAESLNEELGNALQSGEVNLQFRYRYEYVDQDPTGPTDPIAKDANASTLRTRLVYNSGNFRGFKLSLNIDDIRPVVSSDFNDTRNGKTEYPTVADPKGTSVNIAALTYTGIEDTKLVFGRQRIIRNNARFIGNVGWRQNEQTYDSISASYAAGEKLKLFYGYVDSVERVFGPDEGTPAADYDGSTHLLDADYELADWFNVTGYAYLLDLEGNGDDSASNKTFGLRVDGQFALRDTLKLDYAAEFAQQKDYADNPNNYDENYYRIDGGLSGANWGLMASMEVLEGDGTQGFQTPLATLHAFQGLADIFLNTPADGIEDLFVTGKLKIAGIDMMLAYHDFSANKGGQDYGTEIDFTASLPFANYYTLFIGGAVYDADNFATDTTKIWAMLSADF